MKVTPVAVLAALVVAALATASPADLPEYSSAKEAAMKVLSGTRSLLDRELAEKGPAGALDACSRVALQEAKRHEAEGWRVRRVSLKVRNPADRPDRYEAGVLRDFARMLERGDVNAGTERVDVVHQGGRRVLRYMKPIVIASPACLNCHGPRDQMTREVRSRIRALYPRDQATGYELGELRGAVSVSVPIGEPKPAR